MNRQMRNLIPPVYGLLIVVGFIIATGMGVFVIVVGGVFSAVMWTALSRGTPTSSPAPGSAREGRAAARAERRSDRRT